MADTKAAEQIRRKIEKLLRLSRGTNSTAEAESALLKAQQMMLEAGIEAGTFKEAPEARREVVTVVVAPIKPEPWARGLAMVVSKNFRCYVYWHQQQGMTFSGLAGDVLVCVDVYRAAIAHARSLAKFYVEHRREDWEGPVRCARLGAYCTKQYLEDHGGEGFFAPLLPGEEYDWSYWGERRRQYHNPITKGEQGVVYRSFLLGFCDGLRGRYRDQVASQNYALILVRPQEVIEHVATLKTKAMRVSAVRTLGLAQADGKVAGRSFSPFHSSGALGA